MSEFSKLILSVLFILLSILRITAQGENIRFEHITRSSGLSHSTVYSIVQDNYGFIWIGTADGLNRYDGYTVKKYYFDPEKPNSLSNNRIYNLFIDSRGDLWIATLGGGLNKYRYKTDDFIAYKNEEKSPNSLSNDVVMSVYEDKEGFLWVGTAENGLNRFDVKNNTFKRFENNPKNANSLGYKTVISIAPGKNGSLWLALNEGGLDWFDPKKENFHHYKNDPENDNSLCSDRVNHVMTDSRGMVWISTDEGLNLLDPETSKFRKFLSAPNSPYSIKSNEIYFAYEDKNQDIWFATYGGLALLKKENRNSFKFINFSNNPLNNFSLGNNLIRCIYKDKSDMMWVGSFSGGVDKFLTEGTKFRTFSNEPGNVNSLNNNIVRCFAEDKQGNIWVGTYSGGLNKFNPKNGEFNVYTDFLSDKRTSNPLFINSLCIDSSDNLWISTWGEGLYWYNPATGKSKHYINDINNTGSLSNDYIRSIMSDKEGNLWIATSGGGLNLLPAGKNNFTRFVNDKKNANSISDNRVMGLLEDHLGNIWIGSSANGLNKYNKATGKFEHFKNKKEDQTTISSNRVHCIYESRADNSLWIGTGNGLNRMDQKNSTFKRFTKKDGFIGEVIYGIEEDSFGFFWISTSDGLCKFDPVKEKIIKIYDENDGLQSNEFSEGAYFRSKKGILYFGGSKGFSVFEPEKIKDSQLKPPTYLVDFQVFNKTIPIDSTSLLRENIVMTDQIILNYTDYIFSIEFAALNYNNPGKNQYMYKMEGFDEDWIFTDARRRFVTYTNLEPGEYTFKVRASNNDGIWNDKDTEIVFIIRPPYWKTLTFRILAIAFIIIVLILFYKFRVRKLKKQKSYLENAVNEKTKEILVQKEELQTMNRVLSSSNQELNRQRGELELAFDTLKKTQNQLIHSEKMASLGVLAAGVAHEINNPLNFIQGGIFRLENYISDNLIEHSDAMNSIMNGMNIGINRVEAIVASLNHYSRQDSLPRENCDIHTIIDNCLVILQSQTKGRIEITKDYTKELHSLNCNEGKMHQALLNILANAAQAIAKKGKIIIATKVEDDKLMISIEDTGDGISKEAMPMIFDPFFTTKEPGKGTGLGLAITYNIIKEHDGTIDLSSEEGKGTKVMICLPIKIGGL